jgi:hypothetical protein
MMNLLALSEKNMAGPSHVAIFLTSAFANPVNASCVLNRLLGKELCKIYVGLKACSYANKYSVILNKLSIKP